MFKLFNKKQVPNCLTCKHFRKAASWTIKPLCRPQGFKLTSEVYGTYECRKLFEAKKEIEE